MIFKLATVSATGKQFTVIKGNVRKMLTKWLQIRGTVSVLW